MTQSPDSLNYGQGDDSPRAGLRALLFAAGMWFFPALIVIIVFAGCLGALLLPAGPVAGPLLSLFAAYSVRRFMMSRAKLRTQVILGYLENAVRLNMPIDRFLMAAEASETGLTRLQVRNLRQFISIGMPMGLALRRALPGLDPEIAAELDAAAKLGRLQPALTRTLGEQLRPTYPEEPDPGYRFYPMVVLVALAIVGAGMMIFIVPKFREIFKDFRVELPAITQFFIALADLFSDMWPLVALVLILGGLVFITSVGLQLHRIFLPNWPLPRFRRVIDTLAWHVPVWHTVVRDRGLGAACDVLADATRFGLPLPVALEQAESLSINRHLRMQLAAWRRLVMQGHPLALAARKAGLPMLLASFMPSDPQSAVDATALGDTLGFLARYYRERFSPLALALRTAAEPATVLALGVVVGTFIYAFFVPMRVLLGSVIGSYPESPI